MHMSSRNIGVIVRNIDDFHEMIGFFKTDVIAGILDRFDDEEEIFEAKESIFNAMLCSFLTNVVLSEERGNV